MSKSRNNYYEHPCLNSNGYVEYVYKLYPCSIEKQWSVVTEALKFNITKLYNLIIEDIDSTIKLKTEVYNLYSEIIQIFKYKSSNQTDSGIFNKNKFDNLSVIL